jgi:hypothetical protein
MQEAGSKPEVSEKRPPHPPERPYWQRVFRSVPQALAYGFVLSTSLWLVSLVREPQPFVMLFMLWAAATPVFAVIIPLIWPEDFMARMLNGGSYRAQTFLFGTLIFVTAAVMLSFFVE